MSASTVEIDAAIRWAHDDLKAARAAHALRPTANTAHNIQAYEEALNRLLERRKDYR